MGSETKIQWADKTWSPWRGCSKVSEGCRNCYAEKLSKRNHKVLGEWGPDGTRVINADWKAPLRWNLAAQKAGEQIRVFPSLCDPFEDWIGQMSDTDGDIAGYQMEAERTDLFDLIQETPHLDWLLLTKRPEHIQDQWPLFRSEDSQWKREYFENIHLYTSVENQETADKRIPHLFRCRDLVPVLGLSCEPLLGPMDLTKYLGGINHVIIGGESGPNARTCDIRWIRSIVEQCQAAGVPCFVKQLGATSYISFDEWNSLTAGGLVGSSHLVLDVGEYRDFGFWRLEDPKGGNPDEWPEDLRVREMPRKGG